MFTNKRLQINIYGMNATVFEQLGNSSCDKKFGKEDYKDGNDNLWGWGQCLYLHDYIFIHSRRFTFFSEIQCGRKNIVFGFRAPMNLALCI